MNTMQELNEWCETKNKYVIFHSGRLSGWFNN